MNNNTLLDKYLSEYRAGNDAAFGHIYDGTYKAVYYTVLAVLGDRHSSEDVTQEVYITAVRKIDMYNTETNLTGWLVTIAKHLAINEYNKRKNSGEFSADFSSNESLYGECRVEDELNTTYKIAKQILPEDEFTILTLCVMAGYKRREVADMLNMPISTVTWKYNEALKELKTYLKEAENE